ncbi:MAG: 2-hydroxychromene-2-carboxylate isomerase [Paracoccaceae bacterium]|uniref:2-hydroxychromene-2-carboxylate isomerase n=1 Tax=Nonlabens ulvanivorans TaxID=906888 RepID=UPI0032976429
MTDIEFLYDFGSPNAYLVHKILPGIAKNHEARVTYSPILLGGVFKATNNQAPLAAFANITGKVAYIRREFARFIERHAVPFKWNDHFPVNTLTMMRGAVFAQGKAWEQQYIDTCFDAMWVQGANMADPDVVVSTLDAAGLPGADILSATQIPDVKGRLAAVTDDAIARKVFGAPTMFVGNEMFFGKDALNDLAWRLDQINAG